MLETPSLGIGIGSNKAVHTGAVQAPPSIPGSPSIKDQSKARKSQGGTQDPGLCLIRKTGWRADGDDPEDVLVEFCFGVAWVGE